MSGQVQLQSQFFTAGTQPDLDTLNRQLTPPVSPRAGTQQAQAAELIASAILTKGGPADPPAGRPTPPAKRSSTATHPEVS